MAREIPIRNKAGEVIATALVDDADYPAVSRHKWQLSKHHTARRTRWADGHATNVQMHREVVGAQANDGTTVRHVNGDGLDNRRSNLLVVSGAITHALARASVTEVQ